MSASYFQILGYGCELNGLGRDSFLILIDAFQASLIFRDSLTRLLSLTATRLDANAE